ncbi:MAG: DedA family protein [Phycisphaerales bacterium]|nr:DedA family protein [Phycisphaerales bacterium]
MTLFADLLDLFLHLDRHLASAIEAYGTWTYALLVGIIFAETGLVFLPFLPGDSLLFAAGTFARRGSLNLVPLLTLLSAAAILGDTVNYWVGKYLGQGMLRRKSRWIKEAHVRRTHEFFEKYGGKTIVMARFVPIVRTMAPFVAGVGAMTYRSFVFYNIFGGILWVGACVLAGYWFGGLPVVRDNFTLVVLAIVVISVLPAVIEFWRVRREMKKRPVAVTDGNAAHP